MSTGKEQKKHLRQRPWRPAMIRALGLCALVGLSALPLSYAAASTPKPVAKPDVEALLFAAPVSFTPPASVPVKGVKAAEKKAARSEAAPLPVRKPAAETPKKDISPETASAQESVQTEIAPEIQGPLASDDAETYKQIFALQTAGKWDEADRQIARLHDGRLRGHVLYQRYMHPSWRSEFTELSSWLDLYADHPGAERVYKLAESRRPSGVKTKLRRPEKNARINGYVDVLTDNGEVYLSPKKRGPGQQKDIARLERNVRNFVAKGQPDKAWKNFSADAASKLLDDVEYDNLRAHIAGGYMYGGKLERALELASVSAARSGKKAPQAGWVGGLSAWRLGRYKQAAGLFESAATSPYASRWTRAGGAYWASRAHMRSGNIKEVSVWLKTAAQYPRTFYGLIATRAVGWDFDFNWDMPSLNGDRLKRLEGIPAARRAMALVAAGQYHLAEEELRQIDVRKNEDLALTLMAYAHEANLPAYAMRLAEAMPHSKGKLYDAALYPLSPWQPESGLKIDRALINAFIRQESRFDPAAKSRSGATGLMQLMPATASFVSGKKSYKSREGSYGLRDPEINLDIGQRYVADLLGMDSIGEELFSLIIAYNAGPGNLRKWKAEYSSLSKDPLLFIESIPLSETRNFVERVMANYWIYRLRLNQPTPSLEAVAEGRWARYASLDNKGLFRVADNRGTVR